MLSGNKGSTIRKPTRPFLPANPLPRTLLRDQFCLAATTFIWQIYALPTHLHQRRCQPHGTPSYKRHRDRKSQL